MVRQPEGGCIVTVGDWAMVRPVSQLRGVLPVQGRHPDIDANAGRRTGQSQSERARQLHPAGPVLLPPDLPEGEHRQAIDATLVKGEGRPENIAQGVLFFVDNDFVTGVSLPIDGGRSVFSHRMTCRLRLGGCIAKPKPKTGNVS